MSAVCWECDGSTDEATWIVPREQRRIEQAGGSTSLSSTGITPNYSSVLELSGGPDILCYQFSRHTP
jgi:hypothetical protein